MTEGSGKSSAMAGEWDCRFTGAAVVTDIDSANGNNNDVIERILDVIEIR
jgi:hypothetical protein